MRYRKFCYFDSVLLLAFLSTLGFVRGNGTEILKGIDTSVKPCHDFYMHACGKWVKNAVVLSQRDVLEYNIMMQIKGTLDKNEASNSDTLRKIQDYYRSCMNLDEIDRHGVSPLASFVSDIGGWPLIIPIANWSLELKNLTLQKILEYYGKVTGHALFAIDLLNVSHKKKMENYIRLFEKPKFPITRYSYSTYINQIAIELGSSGRSQRFSANINTDIERMITFENSLKKIYSNPSVSASKKDNSISITNLQKTWKKLVPKHPEYMINWLEMISNAFNGTGFNIAASTLVYYDQPNVIERLANLLKETSIRTVVNYVHWTAINALALHTNKKMRGITYTDFANRSDLCLFNNEMYHGLAYVYVRNHYSIDARQKVSEIVKQIQAEMKQMIVQSKSMDSTAKRQSQGKIDNMKIGFGYPEWYNDTKKMDGFHSELEIGPNYFNNVLNIKTFNMKMSLKKRSSQRGSFTDWKLDPREISLNYMYHSNSFVIPLAFFQRANFDPRRPLVIDYGIVGSAIGHAMAHAFDKTGVSYNELGEFQINPWWSKSSKNVFNCFVDQYSSYKLTYPRTNEIIKIDGDRTLNENFAENVGFKTALIAYLSYKAKNARYTARTVLKDYSDELLYFYSLANAWCAPLQTKAELEEDVHSPYSVRINGALSNMPEFSKAFNCKAKDPMNPVKKCVF